MGLILGTCEEKPDARNLPGLLRVCEIAIQQQRRDYHQKYDPSHHYYSPAVINAQPQINILRDQENWKIPRAGNDYVGRQFASALAEAIGTQDGRSLAANRSP